MTTTADVLSIPSVEDLEPRRQAAIRQRWMFWGWVAGTYLVLNVNMFGGALAYVLLFQQHPVATAIAGALLLLLPMITMLFVIRRYRRDTRAVAAAVRERLDVAPLGWTAVWALPLVAVALVLPAWYQDTNVGLAIAILAIGVLGAVSRGYQDPGVSRWVLGTLVAWMTFGAGLAVGLEGLLGAGPAWGVTCGWMMLFPGGYPALVLRRPVLAAVGRDDGIGRLARAFVIFLPVDDRRLFAGDEKGAREALLTTFAGPQMGSMLTANLLKLAAIEEGDRTPWLAGAMLLGPDQAEPFAQTARLLADQGHPDALAFAIFAEANASRTLTAGVAPYTALREALEARAAGAVQ